MTTAVFTKKKPFPAELWHHILPYVFNPLLDTMLNFSLSDPICGNDEPIANPRVPSPWYRDRVLRFSTICRLFHDIVVHILRDHLKRMKRLSYEGYINHIEGESRRIRERVENETEQSRSGGQFLDLKLTLRAVEYLARAYISEIRQSFVATLSSRLPDNTNNSRYARNAFRGATPSN